MPRGNIARIVSWTGAAQKKGVKYLIYPSWVALVFIVFMITFDITGRFAFDSPLPASVELSRVLMPFIMFPPMAYALVLGCHVRVTLFTLRLPLRGQLWCEIIASTIGFAFFGVITFIGWPHFWKSFVIREFMNAAIYIPWWPSKLILFIGTGAICLQFLINLVVAIRKLRSLKPGGVTE